MARNKTDIQSAQAEIAELTEHISALPPGNDRDRALWDRGLIQRSLAAGLPRGAAREIALAEIDRPPLTAVH